MPVKLEGTRTDHRGDALPPGVYALVAPDGVIAGYKVRWREEDDDGGRRNRGQALLGPRARLARSGA
jgi:hypothetical protein